MELTKNNKIILGSVVLLVLIGIYFAFDTKSKESASTEDVINPDIAADMDNGGLVIDATGTGDYKIERVPLDEGREPTKVVPVPDLSRTVSFDASLNLSTDVKQVISERIKSTQATLSKDNGNLESWIQLGLYQKMAGDYAGAAISWKYVADVADRDFISYGNLGDLYAYHMKDKGMAEVYYKQAIANGPTQEYLYAQFAKVYLDVFQDKEKALAVIEQGLVKLPENKSLLQLKASIE